jgi:hypothetical protein
MEGRTEPDTGAHQPPQEGVLPVDDESLRGTRFEFGGRRPYSFTPPRPAYRPQNRPLPGIGTVALGKVIRTTAYGAFVDFLGYRGLVHISQLIPGFRVERVEDVVKVDDEVQVRVIAVDPERRHINLSLVTTFGEAPVARFPRSVAGPMEGPTSPREVEAPVAFREESDARTSPVATPPQPVPATQTTIAHASGQPAAEPAAEPPVAAAPDSDQTRRAPEPPARSARPAAAPSIAGPPRAPSRSANSGAARPAAAPLARTAVPDPKKSKPVEKPSPPEVARHGARAVRRELVDPTHPMARLLSADATWAAPSVSKERARPEWDQGSASPEQRVEPEPLAPVRPEPSRPVHVAEPEPEPESQQPATLEALAARFSQRPDKSGKQPSKTGGDRSRQEREKQAAILDKLRRDAARFQK